MLLIVVAKHNRAEMLNSNTPPAAKAYLLPPGTVAVTFHMNQLPVSCFEASLNP